MYPILSIPKTLSAFSFCTRRYPKHFFALTGATHPTCAPPATKVFPKAGPPTSIFRCLQAHTPKSRFFRTYQYHEQKKIKTFQFEKKGIFADSGNVFVRADVGNASASGTGLIDRKKRGRDPVPQDGCANRPAERIDSRISDEIRDTRSDRRSPAAGNVVRERIRVIGPFVEIEVTQIDQGPKEQISHSAGAAHRKVPDPDQVRIEGIVPPNELACRNRPTEQIAVVVWIHVGFPKIIVHERGAGGLRAGLEAVGPHHLVPRVGDPVVINDHVVADAAGRTGSRTPPLESVRMILGPKRRVDRPVGLVPHPSTAVRAVFGKILN